MRRWGIFIAVTGVLVSGLLSLSNPDLLSASVFPNDAYVHYGKDSSTCNEHMDNLQLPPQSNFVLCRRNSGATSWYAAVYKKDAASPTCTYGSSQNPQTVPANGVKPFPCPINTPGVYRAYVYWYVGNSILMTKCDQWFRKP